MTEAQKKKARRRKKTSMEFVDAPSGFVTLYNYKEPFMPFEGGHGFQGVLLFDGSTDKIQCHFCGEWFESLPAHLHREHNMTASQYKDHVGLLQSSALVSESTRDKLIRKNLGKRMKNLRPGKKKTEAEKEKIRATLLKRTREIQNITGTCPAQLLESLRRRSEELGRVPTIRDVNNAETLQKMFGSFNTALKRAGLTFRKVGMNQRWELMTDESLLDEIRDFTAREGRRPTSSDVRRGTLPHNYRTWVRRFGSLKRACKLAGVL